jgi:hypothetical protein
VSKKTKGHHRVENYVNKKGSKVLKRKSVCGILKVKSLEYYKYPKLILIKKKGISLNTLKVSIL